MAAELQEQQFDVRFVNWDGSDIGLETRTAKAKDADFFEVRNF